MFEAVGFEAAGLVVGQVRAAGTEPPAPFPDASRLSWPGVDAARFPT